MTTPGSTREKSTHSPTSDRLPGGEALRHQIEERLSVPPWVLLVQAFIGLGWLRAAVEKVIDPSWWSGAVLSDFLDAQAELALPWYRALADTLIEPNLLLVSIVVVVAQLFAALALLSGRMMLRGLAVGMFLNLNFVLAGAVNPSIFYLISQMALVLWVFHGEREVTKRPLRLLATASFVLVLLNVPFVSTFDPAAVVEDPAIVLITLGLLTAAVSRAGIRDSGDHQNEPPAYDEVSTGGTNSEPTAVGAAGPVSG